MKGVLDSKRLNKTKIACAILSLIGTVVVGYWRWYPHGYSDTKPKAAAVEQQNFTGRILDRDGKPVVGANVLVTQDQSIGQSVLSDSNGQFVVIIQADTKTMRLSVTANGFQPISLQADIHRTGPEEIILQRLPEKAPHASTEIKSRSNIPSQLESTKPSSLDIPAPATTPTTIINNNGTGTQFVCTSSPCDQSIHMGESKPTPNVTFSQKPIPAERRDEKSNFPLPLEGDSRFYPGVSLTISVDRIFDDPSFEIECSVACVLRMPMIMRQGAGWFRSDGIEFDTIMNTPDQKHYRITFANKLSVGSYLLLTVRSLNDVEPRVLEVKTFSN